MTSQTPTLSDRQDSKLKHRIFGFLHQRHMPALRSLGNRPKGPILQLKVCDGPMDGAHVSVRSVNIDGLPVIVGRSQAADLIVKDPWVSRRHCQLHHVDGALTVRDLGSTHGTFLNGDRVTEAALKRGDEIRIGLSSLVLS